MQLRVLPPAVGWLQAVLKDVPTVSVLLQCCSLGCLAVVGDCCNAGRWANRTWKKTVPLPARGPLQMPGALKPNVVEAHAMELIKSMLYLADTTG